MIEFVVVNFLLLIMTFIWVMKLRDLVEGTWLEKPLRIIVGIPAFIFDWYVNTFAATILFLELPYGWEVVTGRLKRYKKYTGHLSWIKRWRLGWAVHLCALAHRFDKGHC